MRKTENKRKKVQMPAGIRQKMMAAVSMLLVSSIMMVSSTYAWFTLSTAPEVTGITTNVGANGNLEMMLLTGQLGLDGTTQEGSYYSTEDDLGVVSEVGDSVAATQDVTLSNVKWGNLVDLSDESYGLDNIVLAPARLNITDVEGANDTIGTTILNAPSYGSDGRVVDVKTGTYTGKADGSTFAYDEAHKGVRVIGTTTDVSQRLGSYRSAKAGVTTNVNTAKNQATASLLNNGQTLANILVAYVSDPNTTYTNADLKVLKNVLTSLDAACDNVVAGMKNAVIAYSLSDAQGEDKTFTDDEVKNLQDAVNAITTITGTSSFEVDDNVLIPAGLEDTISIYTATADKIGDALTELNALNSDLDNSTDTEGSYTYNDISPILNEIVNRTYVEIAGKSGLTKDDLQLVIDEYTNTGKISMTMLDGSGVYADIAKMVGNYTVSGLKVTVSYNGMNPTVPVTMSTKVSGTVGSTTIPLLPNVTIGSAPQESGQAASSKLSNTYGYALDFGFRTNAANSDLQLQTSAVNRVYTDQSGQTDEPVTTQGSGSYMQFTSSDANNFTAEDVLHLMSAIRVAFVSPTDSGLAEVLAIGALDVTATTDQTGAVTLNKGDTVEKIGETGYKAGLFLHDYTIAKTADGGNSITLGAKQADESAITALTQNKAMKVTVIVYLDGDIVDNTMVANANSSMSGIMNLQFSSSATLAPMENTGMRDGGSTGQALTYTQKAAEGTEFTYGPYTGTVNAGYTIYEASNGSTYFSPDGGTTYIRMTLNNYTAAITVTSTEVEDSTDTGEETPVEGEESGDDTTT